jgi:SWI2/SNF2 ATPase/Type I restriction modification DNA specificity domain
MQAANGLRAYSLEMGDIVFSRVGSVDRNALIRAAEVGWLFSGRLLRVRPDRIKAFAPFLSYQFHGETFKDKIRSVAVGQTMASLNTQILKNVTIVLPTIAEQTAIAEVLTDMTVELACLELAAGEDPQPEAGYDAGVIDRKDQTSMNAIGKAEMVTQNRVITLFRDELKYTYLGDWGGRLGNSNIEERLLKDYLTKCNYSPEQTSRAIYLLITEAKNPRRSLYENNKAIYGLLRYGVDVQIEVGQAKPRLLCSLIHKFGKKDVGDFDAFIEELKKQPSPAVGELFIFVDECHRTQSGKLHKTMKALLPGAVFIGFTGTPLLKLDKQTSLEVFGTYIHTYKFGEAVEDEVVLDLVYEARDIPQELGSPQKVDAWFEAKTKGLNDWQNGLLPVLLTRS